MHCDFVGAQMMLQPGALAEMYWKEPETALLIWLEHGALMIALQNSSRKAILAACEGEKHPIDRTKVRISRSADKRAQAVTRETSPVRGNRSRGAPSSDDGRGRGQRDKGSQQEDLESHYLNGVSEL